MQIAITPRPAPAGFSLRDRAYPRYVYQEVTNAALEPVRQIEIARPSRRPARRRCAAVFATRPAGRIDDLRRDQV